MKDSPATKHPRINSDQMLNDYVVRFDDLKQRGFGMPPVERVSSDQLVNFIFWPANPFDIWIDDFRFEP